MKSGVMEEVRRLFKPEFLNRIDEIMVFHTLNKEEIRKIVTLLLKSLEERCMEQMDIRLNVTNSAVDYLAEAGFDCQIRGKTASPRHPVQDRGPSGQ